MCFCYFSDVNTEKRINPPPAPGSESPGHPSPPHLCLRVNGKRVIVEELESKWKYRLNVSESRGSKYLFLKMRPRREEARASTVTVLCKLEAALG